MNKKIRKEKRTQGITLVALIITIIVLLILAVVTIREITGDGIIAHAQNARKQWNIEKEREALHLSYLSYQIDENNPKKLGTQLYDKDLYNGEKWSMVFSEEKAYGTGWNYIEKGTEIEEYGEAKYEWIINYETGEIIYLDKEKYYQLDYTDSVAVTGTELVMNIDATNLSDENSWKNVTNHGKNADGTGGVTYDEESMALTFDGVDDYLELTKPGDFSNGFTFEMYMNLSRVKYQVGKYTCCGLFCKKPKLNGDFEKAMRFGVNDGNVVAKFFDPGSWSGERVHDVYGKRRWSGI